MFFFRNLTKSEAGRLVLDLFLFLFFKKALFELKVSERQFSIFTVQYISIALNLAYIKNTLY